MSTFSAIWAIKFRGAQCHGGCARGYLDELDCVQRQIPAVVPHSSVQSQALRTPGLCQKPRSSCRSSRQFQPQTSTVARALTALPQGSAECVPLLGGRPSSQEYTAVRQDNSRDMSRRFSLPVVMRLRFNHDIPSSTTARAPRRFTNSGHHDSRSGCHCRRSRRRQLPLTRSASSCARWRHGVFSEHIARTRTLVNILDLSSFLFSSARDCDTAGSRSQDSMKLGTRLLRNRNSSLVFRSLCLSTARL